MGITLLPSFMDRFDNFSCIAVPTVKKLEPSHATCAKYTECSQYYDVHGLLPAWALSWWREFPVNPERSSDDTIWCEAGLIHCTRMWWSHMTHLGEVRQNVWCGLQKLWSHSHNLVSRWSSSMMVPHPLHHCAENAEPQHKDGHHQSGAGLLLSHHIFQQGWSSPPDSSKVLPAQLSGCSLLWGVELKWRGGGEVAVWTHIVMMSSPDTGLIFNEKWR